MNYIYINRCISKNRSKIPIKRKKNAAKTNKISICGFVGIFITLVKEEKMKKKKKKSEEERTKLNRLELKIKELILLYVVLRWIL